MNVVFLFFFFFFRFLGRKGRGGGGGGGADTGGKSGKMTQSFHKMVLMRGKKVSFMDKYKTLS